MTVPGKILLLLCLIFFLLILGSLLSVLLAIPLYQSDFKTLMVILENPDADNIHIVKFFQICQSVFLFILPALMAAWLFGENTFVYLKADQKASGLTLAMVVMSLIMAVPFMNAATVWNAKLDLPVWMDNLEGRIKTMEEGAGRLTELFLESDSNGDLAVNFLMIAILPALGEEFLFRGIIQRLLAEWTKNSHVAIFLAAFIFSFIHFQFYGFIPRLLLGLYFGYLLLWSSSIWVPVTAHLINNGIAVVYYHFTNNPMGESTMDTIGTGQGANYALYLSVFFTSVFIGLIYLHEKNDRRSLS